MGIAEVYFEPTVFRTNMLGLGCLAQTAKYFNAPSILTLSFNSGPNGPIEKEILDALPNAPLIRRPGQLNAMDNEDFANALNATGKKQVIIRYLLPPTRRQRPPCARIY
jgi:hypothetical protein